ncbi:hypothetical protein KM043_010311 [Ampulex compressa]|nr:hypothetical protein KM043_010311 [Ampulex compressa]
MRPSVDDVAPCLSKEQPTGSDICVPFFINVRYEEGSLDVCLAADWTAVILSISRSSFGSGERAGKRPGHSGSGNRPGKSEPRGKRRVLSSRPRQRHASLEIATEFRPRNSAGLPSKETHRGKILEDFGLELDRPPPRLFGLEESRMHIQEGDSRVSSTPAAKFETVSPMSG